MTDTPLLRLARIVAGIAYDQWHPNDSRSVAMDQLVRDLEAAPPPEPARRTITREELGAAVRILRNLDTKFEEDVMTIAAAWRLTVEGA